MDTIPHQDIETDLNNTVTIADFNYSYMIPKQSKVDIVWQPNQQEDFYYSSLGDQSGSAFKITGAKDTIRPNSSTTLKKYPISLIVCFTDICR